MKTAAEWASEWDGGGSRDWVEIIQAVMDDVLADVVRAVQRCPARRGEHMLYRADVIMMIEALRK